jgi:hypothetical protein
MCKQVARLGHQTSFVLIPSLLTRVGEYTNPPIANLAVPNEVSLIFLIPFLLGCELFR